VRKNRTFFCTCAIFFVILPAKLDGGTTMHQQDTLNRITALARQVIPVDGHLWLYGSRARGDFRPDSDWDLLVVVNKDSQQMQDFEQYAYPFVEMGWQIGEEISPMLYTRQEWDKRYFTPFYKNVEQDKILLVRAHY